MEVKRFKFKLIAIALAMPMLFAACNSDEPMLTPEEEFAIKNGSDVEYVKPIIFETENTDWLTEYNAVKNIYTTKIIGGIVTYKIKEGYHVPDIKVKKIVKEQDGKFENVEISEIKEDGFPMYEAGILNITQKSEDTFEVSLSRDFDLSYTYNYRHFHIYLSDSDNIYGTKIIIDDNEHEEIVGIPGSISFDLSNLKYPSKRHYNAETGSKFGHEYSIYLPAEECEFELLTNDIYVLNYVRLLDMTSQDYKELYKLDIESPYNFFKEGFSESLTEKPATYTILTECAEFVFNGEWIYTKSEIVETRGYSPGNSVLKCKISSNESDQERIISINVQNIINRFATFYFIQEAK